MKGPWPLTTSLEDASDGFEVTVSAIHGRGLRSARARRAGDILYTVRGKFVSELFDKHYTSGPNWIGTGWETWLIPERGNPIRFTNHCCVPNVIVSEDFMVVALEDIAPGSEVLLDYATTEVDPYWRLRCQCRSPNCRGQVRSFPFLSDTLRARYTPHLPASFLDAAQRVARTLSTPS